MQGARDAHPWSDAPDGVIDELVARVPELDMIFIHIRAVYDKLLGELGVTRKVAKSEPSGPTDPAPAVRFEIAPAEENTPETVETPAPAPDIDQDTSLKSENALPRASAPSEDPAVPAPEPSPEWTHVPNPAGAVMSYPDIDFEVIDYRLVPLPGTNLLARGPLPLSLAEGGFVCALGAAQTFGRFVERTYLSLLGDRLGVETLNLGMAGAGPKHYSSRRNVLDIVNRASLVIVQVMSGRSVSNSYFENTAAGSLRPRHAPAHEAARHAEIAYTKLFDEKGRAFIKPLIAETRENYLAEYDSLLGLIKVPVILFWFSERGTDYAEFYRQGIGRSAGGFLGKFPQLVNTAVMDRLRAKVDHYAECVTSRGLPQPTRSRFTGEIVDLGVAPRYPGHNNYYPSPEMHEDAAAALLPVVRRVLAGK